MAVCLNHTDTEAVTRCSACGKPICESCVAVQDENGAYCSHTCWTRGKEAAARSGNVIAEKSTTAKSKAIRTLIVIFLLIALAAAGLMYYKGNKKAVDKKLDSAIRQTQATAAKTGAAIKKESAAIKKTLDTDSKYKKNRENLVK